MTNVCIGLALLNYQSSKSLKRLFLKKKHKSLGIALIIITFRQFSGNPNCNSLLVKHFIVNFYPINLPITCLTAFCA